MNNAGVLDLGNVLDAPLAAFERSFATDFYGPLAMSRAFAPVIESNGGRAIFNMLVYFATQPTNLRQSFEDLTDQIRHALGYGERRVGDDAEQVAREAVIAWPHPARRG